MPDGYTLPLPLSAFDKMFITFFFPAASIRNIPQNPISTFVVVTNLRFRQFINLSNRIVYAVDHYTIVHFYIFFVDVEYSSGKNYFLWFKNHLLLSKPAALAS